MGEVSPLTDEAGIAMVALLGEATPQAAREALYRQNGAVHAAIQDLRVCFFPFVTHPLPV